MQAFPFYFMGLNVEALAGVIEQAFRACISKGECSLCLLMMSGVQRATYLGLTDDLPEVIRHPAMYVINARVGVPEWLCCQCHCTNLVYQWTQKGHRLRSYQAS
ncbi:hypothetical protein C1S65_04225 [Pseudomonas putida]|uniref:Uncharacterized protein n=1 Tax=Pseudomonas putida TaxID=303 RepID=A0AAD0PCK3_PSEPU|nr:hypothetical protein C1S65_04225 [Pseudomonas putida]